MNDLYPSGSSGRCSSSPGLQAGHGAPAPPQLQASPSSLAPPHGLSMWSSHTQPAPLHMRQFAFMPSLSRRFMPPPCSGPAERRSNALPLPALSFRYPPTPYSPLYLSPSAYQSRSGTRKHSQTPAAQG